MAKMAEPRGANTVHIVERRLDGFHYRQRLLADNTVEQKTTKGSMTSQWIKLRTLDPLVAETWLKDRTAYGYWSEVVA